MFSAILKQKVTLKVEISRIFIPLVKPVLFTMSLFDPSNRSLAAGNILVICPLR